MYSARHPPPPPAYDRKYDALTLYDSFSEEVLLLTPQRNNLLVPNIDISRKGPSTQNALAPVVWFERIENEYVTRANGIIGSKRVKELLLRSYLPAPYSPCVLNSETDIVQASVLWLLHPVIKALQAFFPNVECAAEVTLGDCRCDALITIAGEHVVVIEYKNRGNIKEKEFRAGWVEDFSPQNGRQIRDKIEKASDRGRKHELLVSCMDTNAMCLTKQAMAYAFRWKTRHVCLFDWDNLFLWHFAGIHFNPEKACQWAYGTPVKDRKNFRAALLGFVIEAYNDKVGGRFEKGKAAPYEYTDAQKLKMQQQRQQQMTAQQRANQEVYRR